MYVECKKKTNNKKTTKQNMFMKCVGPKNIEIKQRKKKTETDKSVIMFSTVECVPLSWVPEQFFAKK